MSRKVLVKRSYCTTKNCGCDYGTIDNPVKQDYNYYKQMRRALIEEYFSLESVINISNVDQRIQYIYNIEKIE